jgi:hypothetical protein
MCARTVVWVWHEVSISSTFYMGIFRTKVISLLRVWLWKNFCTRNACVKCWWNWHEDASTFPGALRRALTNPQEFLGNHFILLVFAIFTDLAFLFQNVIWDRLLLLQKLVMNYCSCHSALGLQSFDHIPHAKLGTSNNAPLFHRNCFLMTSLSSLSV